MGTGPDVRKLEVIYLVAEQNNQINVILADLWLKPLYLHRKSRIIQNRLTETVCAMSDYI